jgi:hypothetical protein
MAGLLDGCKFVAASNGTGDFVVSAAAPGCMTPALANAVNAMVYHYHAESADKTQWEDGEGAYTVSGTTLARTTVLYNSAGTGTLQGGAGSKINFTLAPTVAIVPMRADIVSASEANIFTEAQMVQIRKNLYAAPFDAMAYNGMQINGSMEVSQELGTTGTGVISNYPVDGWALGAGGTMGVTAAQVASATRFPGFKNHVALTVSTAQSSIGADDYLILVNLIEGVRVARLQWGTANAQPLTIGFWTAHHRTGTYSGAIRNSAINRSYPFTYTQNVADTAEFKVITIPGDTTGTWLTDTGIGLQLVLAVAAGSNFIGTPLAWAATNYFAATGQVNGVAATSDVFRVTGLIVLPGIEAPSAARSPFIMRPFDQEMQFCKRYYEKTYPYVSAPGTPGVGGAVIKIVPSNTIIATQDYGSVSFTVAKRAAPTVTLFGFSGTAGCVSNQSGADLAANSGIAVGIAENSFGGRNGNGGTLTTTNYVAIFQWVANARL